MTIVEQVRARRLALRKSNDIGQEFGLLTVLLGEFERLSKNINDTDAQKVILKLAKDFKITEEKTGCSHQLELDLLNEYLPSFVPEETLTAFAKQSKSIKEYMQTINKYAKEHNLILDNVYAKNLYNSILEGL